MPWKRVRGGWAKRGAGRRGFIRNRRQYEALRRKGYSKERAARISNAHGRR